VAEAYWVKCKAKKEIAKPEEVTMKNGRGAIQGVCPDCGTKLFSITGGKK
jgi:hypothetical protein